MMLFTPAFAMPLRLLRYLITSLIISPLSLMPLRFAFFIDFFAIDYRHTAIDAADAVI